MGEKRRLQDPNGRQPKVSFFSRGKEAAQIDIPGRIFQRAFLNPVKFFDGRVRDSLILKSSVGQQRFSRLLTGTRECSRNIIANQKNERLVNFLQFRLNALRTGFFCSFSHFREISEQLL